MENKIENLSPIINEEEINQPKANQTVIIQKIKKINSNKNKLSNSLNKKPLNIDINVEIDNVHLKNMKNTPKSNTSCDSSTIFNYQKKDVYYTDMQDKGANPHPKIIIQKIKNKFGKKQKKINLDKNKLTINTKREYNKRFNTAYNENDLTIRSSDSFMDISNKENLDENTTFFRNTQENKNGIFEKKKNINEIKNKNSKTMIIKGKNKSISLIKKINNDENENKENINDHNIIKKNSIKLKTNNIIDEIIIDDKKSSNDIKIQKLNPKKIPKPQNRKMIERMLRLKDKKIEKGFDEEKTFAYDNKNLDSSSQNISFTMNKTEIISNPYINNQDQQIIDDNANNSNSQKNNNINNLNSNNILYDSNQNVILRGSKTNNNTINNNIFPDQNPQIAPPQNFIVNNINNDNINTEQMKRVLKQNNILPQNMNVIQQRTQNQNVVGIPNQNIKPIQIQNLNIIQPNNNIIPQQIQNKNNIPQNSSNINPLNNIQIPPPTKNQNLSQRNSLFSPRRQIINLFPQNPISLAQKDNLIQGNNNLLNQNNGINQQNINIIPKSNSNPNLFNKKILFIQKNPNFPQQQNYDAQKQNINMIPPKEPYINNQQNIINKAQPNLNINNQRNINFNSNNQQKIIIQKFPSNNGLRKNNNFIFQNNVNNISENLNINKPPISPANNVNELSQGPKNIPPIPQQQNSNANSIKNQNIDFAPNQNNIIQFPPDMNSAKKQNIKLTQNNQQNLQNINIAQKLNFNIFQQPSNNAQPLQNNIQQTPNNTNQTVGNIFQNNINANLLPPQIISRNPNLNKIQNNNNGFERNPLNINKNISINNIPPSNIAHVTKINNEQNNIPINQQKINNNVLNKNNIYINEQQNMNIIEDKNAFQNYQMNNYQNNQNKETEQKLNENIQKLQFLMQLPNYTKIGNFIIKDRKVYYLNQSQENSNNSNNNIPKIVLNLDNNKENINPLNNNYIQKQQQKPIQQNQYSNYITNIEIINNNINNINTNNNQLENIKHLNFENQVSFSEQLLNFTHYQQSNLTENSPQIDQKFNPQQLKNAKKVTKKPKNSRINKIMRLKEMNEHKPTKQYQIERKRPVYAVPPSKKRSVSQGKPFILIHKYYDENYILEDDEEEASKNEENSNIISNDDDEKN